MNKHLKKYVILSMMVAIAIVLNIIEAQFDAFIPVPGAKLGLANIATIIVLYVFGFPSALLVSTLRVFLAFLLMGRILQPSFYMSLAGAISSTVVMYLIKKINFFGPTGASLFGSIASVAAQVVVGYFFIGEGLFVYLPLMLLLSVGTGFVIGLIASRFLNTSREWLPKEKEKIEEDKIGKSVLSGNYGYNKMYKRQIKRNKDKS